MRHNRTVPRSFRAGPDSGLGELSKLTLESLAEGITYPEQTKPNHRTIHEVNLRCPASAKIQEKYMSWTIGYVDYKDCMISIKGKSFFAEVELRLRKLNKELSKSKTGPVRYDGVIRLRSNKGGIITIRLIRMNFTRYHDGEYDRDYMYSLPIARTARSGKLFTGLLAG